MYKSARTAKEALQALPSNEDERDKEIFMSYSSVYTVNQIEKIQKYFTKRLYIRLFPNTIIPNYSYRLGLFQMDPLEVRLIRIDLCFLYCLLVRDIVVDRVSVLRSPRLPGRLQITSVRTINRRSFFIHRTVMLWNKYFSYNQFTSLSQFRSSVNNLPLIQICKGSAFKAH